MYGRRQLICVFLKKNNNKNHVSPFILQMGRGEEKKEAQADAAVWTTALQHIRV